MSQEPHEKITESKAEYESRYGKWLRDMRLEINASDKKSRTIVRDFVFIQYNS